jgi:four helix bundle protein
MEGALQELDETDYWLELTEKGGVLPPSEVKPVKSETVELIAIFTSAVVTAKKNRE